MRETTQRTIQQNKSLHLYFTQLADALNETGYDMKRTLKPEIEIPWNGETVKEYLWRPIMKAQLNKESTTEMTTKELDQVLETLTRHLTAKLGVLVNFPSMETLSLIKSEK